MATYAQWLKSKGLTSTKANAAKWKRQAGTPAQPRTPQAQPAPYSYASQIAADPLSIPFDSSMVWQGKGRPKLSSLAGGAYDHLTPVQRPDGGWAVFGMPTDPTPQWVKDQAQQFTDRGQKVQQFAQGTVAPWLAQQLSALGNIQGQAQTSFANLVGQSGHDIAAAQAAAGPGPAQAGSAYMAPFQAHQGLADQLSAGAAQGATAKGAYQGAVDTLQQGNLAQGLTAGFAQQVAQIPDQWEQQRQAFMRQMDPIIAQIEQSRTAGEQARLGASRRQFNANLELERQVTGIKAKADVAVAQTRAESQAARDAQRAQDSADRTARSQFRTLAQITNDVGRGDALLDNQGSGFEARPKVPKFHGKTVTWEQAQNGRWYGIARAAGGGSGSGSGSGGDSIYTSSTTRQRLSSDLLSHWQGVDPDGAGPLAATPGWSGLPTHGTIGGPAAADPQARQVALWVAGNQQFLKRGGKLRDVDLRNFLQAVLPGVDYSRVRYYLDRVL